jgi:predicted nucleotidyltransferase
MNGTPERLREIFRNAGVVVAYLFGSRARGGARESSDADVAVLLEGRRGLLEQEALADQLGRAMGVPDVDLIVLDEAPLEMRGRVVQEGRVLFSADEARRVAFEVLTRSQYFDFLPTLEAHTRRYLQQVAREGLRG